MKTKLKRRIAAAQGQIECDLVFRNARFLDVFSCEWRVGDIAVFEGAIVGLEPGLKGKRIIDAKGKFLVPGFIDAHVHVESSLMTPVHFQKAVLPRGTTTAISDPHELANVMGVEGIKYFLREAESLALDLRVMLSSCVPATHLETNGGGMISAEQLSSLRSHYKSLGLAEMMNVPGVLGGDSQILDKIAAFSDTSIDGHCPLLSGHQLSAYAAAGISSCHESSELNEAKEKLTKGISIWIREGSVAKDLDALIPLLNMATSTSIGFCTDDRNPLDISEQGHIDYLLRQAMAKGIPAEVVFRSASWSVARHYGLVQLGAIAPGYTADLVLLDDVKTCSIADVFKRGVASREIDQVTAQALPSQNTMRAAPPEVADLEGPKGRVHVIGVDAGKIITSRQVMAHDAPGVARLSVLERHGHNSRPANAYVLGFGANLNGAIASSVGHDSHNLIAVGSNTKDMKVAMASLLESGGGFCVVQGGKVLSRLALPFGGLMSNQPPVQVEKELRILHDASRKIGCDLSEPFLQLAFLSLPVIPSLKLTDKGLVDVEAFQIIDVRA